MFLVFTDMPMSAVKDLQAKIENMKEETSKKIDKLRNETADTLGKIGKSLKKEGEQQETKE